MAAMQENKRSVPVTIRPESTKRLRSIDDTGAEIFVKELGTDEAFLVQLAHAQRIAAMNASIPIVSPARPGAMGGEPQAPVPDQVEPAPWAAVIESLEGAREELAVMVDLLSRIEGGRELAVATLPKPRLHGGEVVAEMGTRLHGKQRALREAAGVLAEGAQQLRRQAEAEGRFYCQLERLQRLWRLCKPATSAGPIGGRAPGTGDADAFGARPFCVDLDLPFSSPATRTSAGAPKAGALSASAMPRLVMAAGPAGGDLVADDGGSQEGDEGLPQERRRKGKGLSVVVPSELPDVTLRVSILANQGPPWACEAGWDVRGGQGNGSLPGSWTHTVACAAIDGGQGDAASRAVLLAHARLHAAQQGLFQHQLMEAVRCDPLVAQGGVDVTRSMASGVEVHLPRCDAGRTLRLLIQPRTKVSSAVRQQTKTRGGVTASGPRASTHALEGQPRAGVDGGDGDAGAGGGIPAAVVSSSSAAPPADANPAGLTDAALLLLWEQWLLRKMDPPPVRPTAGRHGPEGGGGARGKGIMPHAPPPSTLEGGKALAATHGIGAGALGPHPLRPTPGLDDLLAMLAHADARARLLAMLDGLVATLPGLRVRWLATRDPCVSAVQVTIAPAFLAQLKLAAVTPSSSLLSSSSSRPPSLEVVHVRGRLGGLHTVSFLRQLLGRKQGMLPAPLLEMGGAGASTVGMSRAHQLARLTSATCAHGGAADVPAAVRLAFPAHDGRDAGHAAHAHALAGGHSLSESLQLRIAELPSFLLAQAKIQGGLADNS